MAYRSHSRFFTEKKHTHTDDVLISVVGCCLLFKSGQFFFRMWIIISNTWTIYGLHGMPTTKKNVLMCIMYALQRHFVFHLFSCFEEEEGKKIFYDPPSRRWRFPSWLIPHELKLHQRILNGKTQRNMFVIEICFLIIFKWCRILSYVKWGLR